MKEPISWSTAESVASRIARDETFAKSYLRPAFEADMHRLTIEAGELVRQETRLPTPGVAQVRVAERADWAKVNLGLFKELLQPLTTKLSSRSSNSLLPGIGRIATGAQLGVVLGWMSSRVLGQYDMPDVAHSDQHDIVYYVAPNVLSLEKRFGFPPEEFRLWIAIHECTHRAQFMGVPWLPDYFRSLVEVLLGDIEPDTQRLKNALEQLASEVKERRSKETVSQGGSSGSLMALLSSPEQKESLAKLMGLMALLEGHAEVVMSRAGTDRVPSAERFHRVIAERRSRSGGLTKVLQRLLGLDAKMKQYAEGAVFVRDVERAGGAELLSRLWKGPEHLPVIDEIRNPSRWIERHTVADADNATADPV